MFLQIHACILDGMFLYVFWNVCFLEGMFLYVLKGMFCVFYVFRASTLFISTVMRHVFQITKTAGDPVKCCDIIVPYYVGSLSSMLMLQCSCFVYYVYVQSGKLFAN